MSPERRNAVPNDTPKALHCNRDQRRLGADVLSSRPGRFRMTTERILPMLDVKSADARRSAQPVADRRSISRPISPRSRRRACWCASIVRSTRTPSCIRWCAGSSRAGCRRISGARSCSPTWSTPTAARYDMPVVVGALAASPRNLFASAWAVRSRRSRRPGRMRSPIRSRRSRYHRAPCQEVVIKGDELRGAGQGTCRAAGADLDAGLRRRALSHRDACASRAIPRPASRTWAPIAAQLKATDRLGVRMASRIGGAGGYLHWQKHKQARRRRCRARS